MGAFLLINSDWRAVLISPLHYSQELKNHCLSNLPLQAAEMRICYLWYEILLASPKAFRFHLRDKSKEFPGCFTESGLWLKKHALHFEELGLLFTDRIKWSMKSWLLDLALQDKLTLYHVRDLSPSNSKRLGTSESVSQSGCLFPPAGTQCDAIAIGPR